MSMNEYWEKYKNRNRSQDLTSTVQDPKVPNQMILDHISKMQNQLNSIEDRMIEFNIKINKLSHLETQFFIQNPSKQESVDTKVLSELPFIEQRLLILEENNSYKLDQLKNEFNKALSFTESRIFEEIQKNFKKNEDLPKHEENSYLNKHVNEFHKWQKKIEKIVMVSAEKLKFFEGKNEKSTNKPVFDELEHIESSILKCNKNQKKFTQRLDELEEFSKKMCKRLIEMENDGLSFTTSAVKNIKPEKTKQKSPLRKNSNNDSFKTTCSILYIEPNETNRSKNLKNRSISPTSQKKIKKNKLDKVYQALQEL